MSTGKSVFASEKISSFRERSRSGVVKGVRIVHGDRATVNLIARSGVDFIYLDQQHGTISVRDIYEISGLLAVYETLVLVRTLDQGSAGIGLALDAGAHGIILPEIENADQAMAFVRSTRFPPAGARSWGTFAMGRTGYSSPVEAIAPICWALVESPTAVAQIDSIAAVSGLDGIYVGRFDLALSMKVPIDEITKHEDHNAAIAMIRNAADNYGIPIGTSGDFAQLSSQGFRILTVSSELDLILKGLSSYLSN